MITRIRRLLNMNTYNQTAAERITFTARDLTHLDELMEIYENEGGNDPGIKHEEWEPEGFSGSGGFVGEDVDYTDENGVDCRKELVDWNWINEIDQFKVSMRKQWDKIVESHTQAPFLACVPGLDMALKAVNERIEKGYVDKKPEDYILGLTQFRNQLVLYKDRCEKGNNPE